MNAHLTTLHSLIQAVLVGGQAYAQAAEGFGSESLGSVLMQLGSQRTYFAERLVAEAQSSRVPAMFPALRRGDWEVTVALDGTQRALLQRLLVREDAVMFRYSMAMACDLPQGIMSTLAAQFAEVGDASDRIRELVDIAYL